MELKTFIENLEVTINNVEPGTLKPETNFRKLPQWDSMAFLCVLAMIDDEYGVELPEDELLDCDTVRELYEAIADKS